MHLVLERFYHTDAFTLGMLRQDGAFLCFILENGPRDEKVHGETRIPAGPYRLELRKEGGFHQRYQARYSDIHKGMLKLRDVPNFRFILVHVGNWARDTKGCLLTGNSADMAGFVGSSGSAYRRIYPPIAAALEAGEEVIIDVRDE